MYISPVAPFLLTLAVRLSLGLFSNQTGAREEAEDRREKGKILQAYCRICIVSGLLCGLLRGNLVTLMLDPSIMKIYTLLLSIKPSVDSRWVSYLEMWVY